LRYIEKELKKGKNKSRESNYEASVATWSARVAVKTERDGFTLS
jgi:hypothetical protein